MFIYLFKLKEAEHQIVTLGAVGGFRKWSCDDLKIKKYLRQNEYIETFQTVYRF
jgi:hypothetical protein